MPWLLIRTALQSVSELAIIPMQDVLALDGQHRMNTPGTTEDNWQWKFDWEMLEEGTCQRLAYLNALYGRV
ncbi:4-alpha-glucanotransferase [Methylophaga lonarensis]|nr:4-alpha-glucanotransferase [Methylophaga lonarensis]